MGSAYMHRRRKGIVGPAEPVVEVDTDAEAWAAAIHSADPDEPQVDAERREEDKPTPAARKSTRGKSA